MKLNSKPVMVGAAALAVIGLGAMWLWSGRQSPSQPGPGQIVTVSRGNVSPTLAVTGFVVSPSQREINAGVSGRILKILVKPGDNIKKGQALVELDKAEAERALDMAKTAYSAALLRLEELRDRSAADSEIAEQRYQVKKAKAERISAAANLYETTIRSPIAGTVLNVNGYVGDNVSAGTAGGSGASSTSTASSAGSAGESSGLITVANLKDLQISASIDQADISKVRKGQRVSISLDAIADRRFAGVIDRIDPVPETNNNVVTYTAYVSFSQADAGVNLGMSADLDVDLGQKKNALTLPNAAIISRNGMRAVLKMTNGAITPAPVKVGASDGRFTEILSGLAEGDSVMVRSLAPSNRGNAADARQGGGFTGPGAGGPGGGGGGPRGGGGPGGGSFGGR